MIHAALKIEGGHEKCASHCPKFVTLMNDINELAGTNITVGCIKKTVEFRRKKLFF